MRIAPVVVGQALPRKRRAVAFLGKASAYALIPMIGAMSPILAIPAIVATSGAEGWAALAIGQSIGSAGGVLIELAWGLDGPQRVAASAPPKRRILYTTALLSRMVIALVTLPVVVSVAWILSSSYELGAAMNAVATACAVGLSPSFFFLGAGEPVKLVLLETAPRVFLVFLGVCLLLLGAPLLVYPILLFFGAIFSALAGFFYTRKFEGCETVLSWKRIAAAIFEQKSGTVARLVSAGYMALPTAIVASVAPASVPVYAAVDRLLRLGLVVLQAVPNSLQNWLGRVEQSQIIPRSRIVVIVNTVVGLVAMAGFWTLAPPISRLLFVGQVNIPANGAMLGGLIILVTCISRATGGLVLVRCGLIRGIAVSAALGAAAGVPLIMVAASKLGWSGALIAVLAAEILVLIIQIAYVNNAFRDLKRRSLATRDGV